MNGAPIDLVASARRMGHEGWLARRTFEVLGGWIPTTVAPEAKRMLAAHCEMLSWHAALWRDRIPTIGDITADAVTAPTPAISAFVDAVAAAEGDAARLAGAYRVLVAHQAGAHTAWRQSIDVRTDAPTARVLDLVLRDELDAWREGDAMARSVVTTPADAAAAARHQGELEALLLSARAASRADAAARGTATRS